MKGYIFLPAVLLAGLIIGGWGTRAELRDAKAEIENLKKRALKTESVSRGRDISGVTRLLNIDSASGDDAGAAGSRRVAAAVKKPDSTGDISSKKPESGDQDLRVRSDAATNQVDDAVQAEENKNLAERIEKAAELWQVRSDIARSTFVNNAKLDSDQTAMFDVLVDAMNVRLADSINRWVETVQTKERIGPEDTLRLVSESSAAIVTTYDEMDRTMPAGWREAQEEPVIMMDFVDPTVAMPLVKIEDKLQNAGDEAGVRDMRRRPGKR